MQTIQRMRSESPSQELEQKLLNPGGGSSSARMATTLQPIQLSTNVPLQRTGSHRPKQRSSSTSGFKAPKTPRTPGRSHSSSTTASSQPVKLWFDSPRLEQTDSELFPDRVRSDFVDPSVRWQAVSRQAGSHQQDGSVLRLQSHVHSPQVLKYGIPRLAAARVEVLHVPVRGDQLPAWMDAIATTLINLKHLHVEFSDERDRENDAVRKSQLLPSVVPKQTDDLEVRRAKAHSNRLRRLYILFRLPDLLSIDGLKVTSAERRLARPEDPNGQKVKRHEWFQSYDENSSLRISLLDHDEGESGVEVDMLRDSLSYSLSIAPQPTVMDEVPASDTHREKAVEVALTGETVEVDLSQEHSPYHASPFSPRRERWIPSHVEIEEEVETADDLVSGIMCLRVETHATDAASVMTADCEWGAACGMLFRNAPGAKTLQKESAKSKFNFRKSSSWKTAAVEPADEPDVKDPNYAYTSTPVVAKPSPPGNLKKYPLSDRLGPLTFVDFRDRERMSPQSNVSPLATKAPTFSRGASFRGTRSEIPKSNNNNGEASTKGNLTLSLTRRLPPAKSLTSPFAMQFIARNKPGRPNIVTEEDTTAGGPVPPPTPKTSKGAPTSLPNMGNVEFTFAMKRASSSPARTAPARSTPTSLLVRRRSCPTSLSINLPPKHGAGANNTSRRVPSITLRRKKKNKKQRKAGLLSRWREQQSARSTSIIDVEDEEEEGAGTSSSTGSVSEEEDLSITHISQQETI